MSTNTLRSEQHGRHLEDDFQMHFCKLKNWITIRFLLKFVRKCSYEKKFALVSNDFALAHNKPLPGPILTNIYAAL